VDLDIGIIDHFANNGKSHLHRTSTVHKMILVGFILASIVVSDDLMILLSIYLILSALVISTRLPFLKVISIAAYPSIFALLFAIASWNGNWLRSGVIVFKALSAALSMVLLITTTPYPSVFASLSPFLPKIVLDGLFLTYRSLFILLELMENLIRALRVRGGLTPRRYIKNTANLSSGIGLLLIRGFDLAQGFYGVMRIRGYRGEISEGREKSPGRIDLITTLIGVSVFAASLGARLGNRHSRYGLYLLITSVLLLLFTSFYFYLLKNRGETWKSS
jgi:cobalt/nickel transport system permease protein